jgi:hypothetical protein
LADKIPKLKQLSVAKRLEANQLAVWTVWVNLPKVLGEQVGWEKASTFIKEIAYADAFNDAPGGLANQGQKGKNAITAMLAGLDLWAEMMPTGLKGVKIIEATPKKCTAEYKFCSQCDAAERLGTLDRKNRTHKIDYPGIDEAWWGHLAQLVKPTLKVKFDSLICRGDPKTRLTIYDES